MSSHRRVGQTASAPTHRAFGFDGGSAPKRLDPPYVCIQPGGPVTGSIRPPGSKSLTNRALICAALADGVSTIAGGLRSDDTRVMIDSLDRIGVRVNDAVEPWNVAGPATAKDDHRGERELFIANSGTSVRFLTAMLSAIGGQYVLAGVERMHARPIGDLINALQIGSSR